MVSTSEKQQGRKRNRNQSASGSPDHSQEPVVLEWISAGMGTVLLLSILALLTHEALFGDKSPGEIKITVEKVIEQNDSFLVRFRAQNLGGQPVAKVSIDATLVTDTGEKETSTTEIDYLPSHSERGGGLFFKNKPNLSELEVRALGYQDP